MKKIIDKIIFFAGWMLSPFTFWNDIFVNIPIAYVCAILFAKILPVNFLATTVVFYWLSNGLGILMMYLSGKDLLRGEKATRELISLAVTMAVYTIVLILLHAFGVLKPI